MAFNPREHLSDLKGKDYLEVKWRLVWFREEKPLWNIDTKLEKLWEGGAMFSCKIYDEAGNQKASGYGSETAKDFRDFIEKAETKAIGRALAMLGYGTQFTGGELDEGARIVDAPVERSGVQRRGSNPSAASGPPPLDRGGQERGKQPPAPVQQAPFESPDGNYYCENCGQAIAGFKQMTPRDVAALGIKTHGAQLCIACGKARSQNGRPRG